jgi:hypothetical protein
VIFVFLSRKLITLDTIVPLLHELKQRAPDARFELICFDKATEDTIRENVVLHEAVQKLGRLRMMGRWGSGWLRLLGHRIWIAGALLRIAFWLMHPRTRLVHFKALNEWPLRLLYCLAPSRTIYVQGAALAQSDLEKTIDQLNKPRRYRRFVPAAGRLVGFQPNWPLLSNEYLKDVPRHIIPEPASLTSWHDYLRVSSQGYLKPFYVNLGGEPENMTLYILSSLDRAPILADPDGFPRLFGETLEILSEVAPDLAVAVKPHPATKPKYRQIIADIIAARRAAGQNVIETHLHPLLLAQKVNFFIANMFSTTFLNAAAAGVPTIEYTHLTDEVLSHTQGGSFRPELVTHFVHADPVKLKSIVRALLQNPTVKQPVTVPISKQQSLDALFRDMSGTAAANELQVIAQ